MMRFICIVYDLPASMYPFRSFPNINWESKQTTCLFSVSMTSTTDCKTIHLYTRMLLRTLMYMYLEVEKRKGKQTRLTGPIC